MKKYTDEMIQFLREVVPGKTHVEITELFNKRYNLDMTTGKISSLLKRKKIKTGLTGRFEKGFKPWNKGTKGLMKANETFFKNSNIPANLLPLGSERTDLAGYTLIKTKFPNIWELKHRVLWKKANGEIPKGSAIIFADGDKTNFNLDNLICVTKNELRQLNRYKLKKDNAELTKVGISIVKLKSKLYKLKKEKK